MIITIDGFVASGKSTISRKFAIKNNFFHISSGLFYRAYGYELLQKNIDLKNDLTMYYVVLGIVIASFLLIVRIIHSPFGQVLKAVKERLYIIKNILSLILFKKISY